MKELIPTQTVRIRGRRSVVRPCVKEGRRVGRSVCAIAWTPYRRKGGGGLLLLAAEGRDSKQRHTESEKAIHRHLDGSSVDMSVLGKKQFIRDKNDIWGMDCGHPALW